YGFVHERLRLLQKILGSPQDRHEDHHTYNHQVDVDHLVDDREHLVKIPEQDGCKDFYNYRRNNVSQVLKRLVVSQNVVPGGRGLLEKCMEVPNEVTPRDEERNVEYNGQEYQQDHQAQVGYPIRGNPRISQQAFNPFSDILHVTSNSEWALNCEGLDTQTSVASSPPG